jgi:hypothetical protein
MIEEFMITSAVDAKPLARQLARMAYLRYKELYPEKASQVFMHFDGQIQKSIMEEEEFGINTTSATMISGQV